MAGEWGGGTHHLADSESVVQSFSNREVSSTNSLSTHTHKIKPKAAYISALGLALSSVLLFLTHNLCFGGLEKPKCNPRVQRPFSRSQEEVGKSRPKSVSPSILLVHYVARINIQDLK